jgi:hypothetical protein
MAFSFAHGNSLFYPTEEEVDREMEKERDTNMQRGEKVRFVLEKKDSTERTWVPKAQQSSHSALKN